MRKSIEEGGLKWWRSGNGVVLTEGDAEGLVPLRFVKRVVDRGGGRERERERERQREKGEDKERENERIIWEGEGEVPMGK